MGGGNLLRGGAELCQGRGAPMPCKFVDIAYPKVQILILSVIRICIPVEPGWPQKLPT